MRKDQFLNGLWSAIAEAYNLNDEYAETVQVISPASLYIVTDGEDKKLLKRYKLVQSDRLAILENILSSCSVQGCCPDIYLDQNGDLISTVGQAFFSLMAYVDTRAVDAGRDAEVCAEVVAKMHKTLADFGDKHLSWPLAVEQSLLRDLLITNGYDNLVEHIDQAEEYMDQVRIQLVHNDLHQGNFLASRSGEIFIIDFESCSTNPLVVDVLFAAFRLAAGDMKIFQRFIEQYQQPNPLTDSEKQYGISLLAADFIKKFGFILKERDRGNDFFMKDYHNYLGFIDESLRLVEEKYPL